MNRKSRNPGKFRPASKLILHLVKTVPNLNGSQPLEIQYLKASLRGVPSCVVLL